MNTTRMYPRTLAEAFPQDHACAIEGPTKEERRQKAAGRLVAAVSAAMLVASIYIAWRAFA